VDEKQLLDDFKEISSTAQKDSSRQKNGQSRQKVGNAQTGFLSIGQAAKHFSIPERTLRHWCEAGKIAAIAKPYGKKTTYQISPQAVEFLLQAIQQEQVKKEAAKNPINHRQSLAPWKKTMERGGITGKAFSPLTVDYYYAYAEAFLEEHGSLSTASFKEVLMEIPARQFAKRYKLYKSLVCFGKFLIREGQLEPEFLDEVKGMAPKRYVPPKRQSLDLESLQRLMDACKCVNETLLVTLLSNTGLRVSEACALLLSDVDLEKGILQARCGKGGKTRQMGLTAKALEAMKNHLKHRKTYKPTEHVFLNQDGAPQTRHGLGRRLERIGNRAGLKVTPHTLRRAFVTLNANKGRPLQMLQMACGHSDIKTTMSYCRTTEQEVIEAMKEWD
jgi:integrase/recombinase XerD